MKIADSKSRFRKPTLGPKQSKRWSKRELEMATVHNQKQARRLQTKRNLVSYRRSDAAKMHLSRLDGVSRVASLRIRYLDLKAQQKLGRKFRPSRFAGGYCASVDDLLALVKADIRTQLVGCRSARTLGPVIAFLP